MTGKGDTVAASSSLQNQRQKWPPKGKNVMWKTFRILIKKVRFYVFIVSTFFMVQAVVLEYQYKTEYNRVLGEYKQHQRDGTTKTT